MKIIPRLCAAFATALLAAASAVAAAPPTRVFHWSNDTSIHSLDPYARQEIFELSFDSNIYEPLVRHGRDLAIEPALATSWLQPSPVVWRFLLRHGVKFQDGTSFTADDVVFSFDRVRARGSHLVDSVEAIKEVRKIDDFTVDIVTMGPDPILLEEIATWDIMSKAWCEANETTEPAETGHADESFATDHADGTGPFQLMDRQPEGNTILVRNMQWWDKPQTNIDEAVLEPIADADERVAALVAGRVDMIYNVPPESIDQLAAAPSVHVLHGPELRTIMLGFNQFRDELSDGNSKGHNPWKDKRVRQAAYQAIDEDQIAGKVMRGLATPAGLLIGPGINGYDAALDTRLPYDPAAAKQLLADAGYPKGFATGMDCPTDRYVNDEAICESVVAMLDRVDIKVRLLAQPRAQFFGKIMNPKFGTSFYLFGWTPEPYDAQTALINLAATHDPANDAGNYNIGGYSNPTLDLLISSIRIETDADKRRVLLGQALTLVRDDVAYVPLHQQAVLWAARDNVDLVQPADNGFPLRFVRMK